LIGLSLFLLSQLITVFHLRWFFHPFVISYYLTNFAYILKRILDSI